MAHKSSDAGSDSRRNINKDAEQTTTIGTGRGRERDGDRCQMEGQKRALFGQNCRLHEDFRSIFGGHLNGGTPPLLLLLRRPLQRCRPRCRRSRPTLATAANQSPTLQQNFPKSEEKKKEKKNTGKGGKECRKNTHTGAHTHAHTKAATNDRHVHAYIYMYFVCACVRVCWCLFAQTKPRALFHIWVQRRYNRITRVATTFTGLPAVPGRPAGAIAKII